MGWNLGVDGGGQALDTLPPEVRKILSMNASGSCRGTIRCKLNERPFTTKHVRVPFIIVLMVFYVCVQYLVEIVRIE